MAAEPQRSARILSPPPPRGLLETGPYQLLENLGPAPFGNAWLAADTRGRGGPVVVLKVIPPSRPGLWEDSTSWEILLAETEALGWIDHPGLPDLLEIHELKGSLLIAFTYAEGPTLRELIAQGERPDRATLVDWGGQLLDALAEAHAQGILHRHLTEDEVIVTPQGRLVLAGFGLTQLVFHPAPPEPLAGELYTPQSDLHAVGCLLRRLAFAGGVCGSRAGRRRLGARDPLLRVLARAASLDPAARYESAEEMAEALREAGRVETAPVLRREVDAAPDSGPLGRVAVFPQRFHRPPQPSAAPAPAAFLSSSAQEEDGERGDLWRALLLLVASLLLTSFVLTTGWLLLGGDGARPGGGEPAARSQSPVRPMGPPPTVLSR